ncbi:MAG TPA: response regulator [Cytophagaceae bacterium]|jgi:DNA-binding NtrC family response regulator
MVDNVLDILVVEDEMSSALLTERIKSEFPSNVNVFTDGTGIKHDLQLLANRDIDLVILDHQYANVSIADAIKVIRKRRPDAGVIVLSSNNSDELARSIKDAGAYDFIYKDKSALDKVIYTIKAFISHKNLKKENLNLRRSSKKSSTTIALLVILAVIAIGILIYLLT